ncbi:MULTISPECIES: GNAT family N-acetyltransferase [Streptomyces]|uniref:GNAT family N-acetyltransferase n=1 Tax=Streptomyces TaxID=1883 RepID=UPI000F7A8922|nr:MULTISPECIES: GNAT family protein [Streptomyces]RST01880.1 N-acetyltransferase [Streptomyces sp. WAC07149]GLX23486.1 N-acetyltransferase [Streptomyces lavendulae subsp. lavendulae]GLX31465.1 N-acetyltransferase [Streptomyces lavendulae subsp. lavendulae]
MQLEGGRVRLEPLEQRHHDGLCDAVRDGNLWELAVTLVPRPGDVRGFIADAVAAREAGREVAYATVDLATGRIAGSTRLMMINTAHRRLEIGWTFLGRTWQRTGVNAEAKLLMLTHAFEDLGMNRVELLTDVRNSASRAAIARLGATQEGIMRQHMVMRDGHVRDTVVFALTRAEWPDAKRALRARLGAGHAG